jgi:uncharacterized protein YbbC (DUF1343 family)
MALRIIFVLCIFQTVLAASVKVGADFLFEDEWFKLLKGKKIGLVTNQSAINTKLQTTFDLLKEQQKDFSLVSVFAPEHGFYGSAYACAYVEDQSIENIPLYGLFGVRRRPTADMLAKINLLVFDLQDIGSRSYTFVSTLFYCMEEAAKASIPVIVLDRPNPMGGLIVDGPMVEEKWRSFLGYINVPYCHGMTIGELASFFNQEYHIGCDLKVIRMKGWKREMLFSETGLAWVPTSPQIPEPDTPFFYPATGLIGHCSLANIGIGYTLPFKLIGAPWIDANQLAENLNLQKLPGVFFQPCHFRPFFGKFKLKNCQGVRIIITSPHDFLPVTTQFTILGVLKNLYPKDFKECLSDLESNSEKKEIFHKICGSEEILKIITQEKYIIWKLRNLCSQARDSFMPLRRKYLFPEYS